jgi:hypothetical protein
MRGRVTGDFKNNENKRCSLNRQVISIYGVHWALDVFSPRGIKRVGYMTIGTNVKGKKVVRGCTISKIHLNGKGFFNLATCSSHVAKKIERPGNMSRKYIRFGKTDPFHKPIGPMVSRRREKVEDGRYTPSEKETQEAHARLEHVYASPRRQTLLVRFCW